MGENGPMFIVSQFAQPPGPLADAGPDGIPYLNRGYYLANVGKEEPANPFF